VLEVAGGHLVDDPADGVGAGEGDLADEWVLDQGGADLLPEPGHDVDHARRQSRLVEQPYQLQGGGGGELRRLDDDRAPGGQGRGQLPSEQQQRRVPRGDEADDTHRLLLRVGEVPLLVQGDDRALDLVGEPAVVVEPLGQIAQLPVHLGEQLAVVANLYLGQAAGVHGDGVPE
jgi:hypothetical protein